jgi:hypothetical protein
MADGTVSSVRLILDRALSRTTPICGQQSARSTAGCTVVVGWTLVALMLAYFICYTLLAAWKTLNTDFPNYYLTARLTREQNDTSRIYEWIWLQRQKDHRDIDQQTLVRNTAAIISGFERSISWAARDRRLTPAEFNVLDMSFLPSASLIFSAELNRARPELFLLD